MNKEIYDLGTADTIQLVADHSTVLDDILPTIPELFNSIDVVLNKKLRDTEKEMLRYKTQLQGLLDLQPEIDRTLEEYEELLNIVYAFLNDLGVDTSDIKDVKSIKVIFHNIVEAMHDLRVKCLNK